MIAPGSIIGIVGGGQLGRMLAMAAAQLGYKCHIYAPEDFPPAAEVSALFTQGRFEDEEALGRFGSEVDVATYEFENIPAAPLHALATKAPLYPPASALGTAQDRLSEKQFIERLDGKTAPFAAISSEEDLTEALGRIGTPAILKTRRFGYDGKGQARIMAPEDAGGAWEAMTRAPSLLEGFVSFDAEFSIILCRSASGETVTWDAPRNVHKNGILDISTVPAGEALRPAIVEAEALARKAADALSYVGILTLEFFAVGDSALFNEMAPRVHNSGHWTIEGAFTSQFENHIRAICGLPLGDTALTSSQVAMRNLIGSEADKWAEILTDRRAHLHLYGKGEARPGRKMGHVTWLGS